MTTRFVRFAFTACLLVAGPSGVASAMRGNWVATWRAPMTAPTPSFGSSNAGLAGQTSRQIVHVSVGGTRTRVRFSNLFGGRPLDIGAAHIARPAGRAGIACDRSFRRAQWRYAALARGQFDAASGDGDGGCGAP